MSESTFASLTMGKMVGTPWSQGLKGLSLFF